MAEIPPSTFFTSQRLWFRAPEELDVPLIMAWRNDPRMRRTTHPRFPLSQQQASKWLEDRNPFNVGTANDHAMFMFGLKGTVEAVGNAALFGIDWPNRNTQFGILVDPSHWSRGYGREVAARLVEYAFDELSLHRVQLHVLASNSGGVKAYQAAGFVQEGTLRQADFVEGRWEDVLLMAILSDEWQRPAR
jgi:RimJ/RimL family protein N-acetyltransferase